MITEGVNSDSKRSNTVSSNILASTCAAPISTCAFSAKQASTQGAIFSTASNQRGAWNAVMHNGGGLAPAAALGLAELIVAAVTAVVIAETEQEPPVTAHK